MTSAMELNFAAGLRAELENNRNRSLFGQAQIALNSFYNLQKNISTITEGLSIFEAINPSNANVKTENKEESIPNTECGNPSNNENKIPNKNRGNGKKRENRKRGEKRENRKKGPSGKPMEYFIKCKNEKQAYEAAKNAGKGKPIKHAHPKKGNPHYHPNNNKNDYEGLEENIQKDGNHFMYPK